MPVTIQAAVNDIIPELSGAPYPNNVQALAYRPHTTFRGSSPSSTGVFPDVALAGTSVADAFHIHQIVRAGVIYKVCVTFMKKGAHVSWAFYIPDTAANRTFNRVWRGKHDAAMDAAADAAMEEFAEHCPTMPAIAANEAVIASLNAEAAAKKKAEEEAALAAKSAFAPPVLSTSVKDRALFAAVTVPTARRTEEEVNKIISDYEKTSKVDPKDLSMVKTALRDNKPKEEWNKFIRVYYDGMFPS